MIAILTVMKGPNWYYDVGVVAFLCDLEIH